MFRIELLWYLFLLKTCTQKAEHGTRLEIIDYKRVNLNHLMHI